MAQTGDGCRGATGVTLRLVSCSWGGTGDARAGTRASRCRGARPPPCVPRRPRTRDRRAQGRVRAGPADHGRTGCAGGPDARLADLRAEYAPPSGPRAPAARGPARPTVSIAAKLGACLATGPAVLVGAYFTSNDLLAKWLFVFVIVYYLTLMVAGVVLLGSGTRRGPG